MGWLIPKTYLKWREPKAIRQTREALAEKALPGYFRPLAVFVCAALIMLNWFLATLDPQKNPPPLMFALPLSLMGGVLFVYIFPLFYRLCPSEIRVTEIAITRTEGDHPIWLKYRDIRSCRIALQQSGHDVLAVLEITTHKGRTTIWGIDPAISLDDLQCALAERGVDVCRLAIPFAKRDIQYA